MIEVNINNYELEPDVIEVAHIINKSPYIGSNGNWYVFDSITKGYMDTGVRAEGTKGDDGFTPIATVTKSGNKSTISITDKEGTTTAEVLDGEKGDDYVITSSDYEAIAERTKDLVPPYDDTELRGEIAELSNEINIVRVMTQDDFLSVSGLYVRTNGTIGLDPSLKVHYIPCEKGAEYRIVTSGATLRIGTRDRIPEKELALSQFDGSSDNAKTIIPDDNAVYLIVYTYGADFTCVSTMSRFDSKADKSELASKVGFEDYALFDKGGIIKLSTTYGATATGGALRPFTYNYNEYKGKGAELFIGKGTLENVLAERLKGWQIIVDQTLAEPVRNLSFNIPSGTKELKIVMDCDTESIAKTPYFRLNSNNSSHLAFYQALSGWKHTIGFVGRDYSISFGRNVNENYSGGAIAFTNMPLLPDGEEIEALLMFGNGGDFATGTHIQIWGR